MFTESDVQADDEYYRSYLKYSLGEISKYTKFGIVRAGFETHMFIML